MPGLAADALDLELVHQAGHRVALVGEELGAGVVGELVDLLGLDSASESVLFLEQQDVLVAQQVRRCEP